MQTTIQTSDTQMLKDPAPDLRTMRIFDVRLDNIDRHTAMEWIRQYVTRRDSQGAAVVYFTNVHSIHLSQRDEELRAIIDRADLVLPDGSGVSIAGKVMGNPVHENLNGTDLMPRVLGQAEKARWSVYLFGARSQVLNTCRTQLMARYPRLQIAGTHHGYVSEKDEAALIEDINACRPDLLLVGLGSPRQEKWIDRNAQRLQVGVCFAVGGLFDFMSGAKKRAPGWMRRLGIEWLFRLIIEPKGKWDRTFVEMPLFLLRVLAARYAPRFICRIIEKKWQAHEA